MSSALKLSDIQHAGARIAGLISRTPVLSSGTLDAQAGPGAKLFFKCENLQKSGTFKARGATNAVFSLTDKEAARGVVTHSSGNHAAALARAAKLRGVAAHVVMPGTCSRVKRAAVARYGGYIICCESTLEARESAAAKVMAATSASFIHPYDDLRVMAGQGTAALELIEDTPAPLDLILCPVGGGGLLSGTAVAAKGHDPGIQVIGVEPEGADDASRSYKSGQLLPPGQPRTIADALLGSLSARTFAEIRAHVDGIVTVTDGEVLVAMRLLWEVMKIMVEPSGAVAYAAVLAKKIDVRERRVGILVSGGNVDLDKLPWTP